MEYNFLEVNKRVDLEITEGPYRGNFKSKISEINEDELEILAPMIKEEVIPIRKNSNINVFLTGDNAAYRFSSRVIDRKNDPIPILVIKFPEKIERIQRRDYFRLELQIEVRYRCLNEEGDPVENEFKNTVSSDLSGGGIKLIVEERLPENILLELYLNIPEINDVPILGKVVNNYNLEDGKAVGVKFTGITSHLRDKIVGWLFDKQRELRKKGLL